MNEVYNPSEKHLATPAEREQLERSLGHLGLVDATLYDYPTVDRPLDNQWVILGED